MPLDTIYLTRHGVGTPTLSTLTPTSTPQSQVVTMYSGVQLTQTPAPSKLHCRPQNRHIQLPVPYSYRQPSRPNPYLARRTAIARTRSVPRQSGVPAETVPHLLKPVLPVLADDTTICGGFTGAAEGE